MAVPATLSSLLTLGFATLVFPSTIEPLMPALQNSFWLTTHVSICFIGYAAFALAYLICLLFLLKRDDWHRHAGALTAALSLVVVLESVVLVLLRRKGILDLKLSWASAGGLVFGSLLLAAVLIPAVERTTRFLRTREVDPEQSARLDLALYRTTVFGFLFLTVGIITGSVWAQWSARLCVSQNSAISR